MSKLSVTIVSESLACSSLIFGYCWTPVDFKDRSLKDFAREIKDTFARYTLNKYAFVVCSSNITPKNGIMFSGDQIVGENLESKPLFEKYLKALGFTDTPRVYCEKNKTEVKFWTIPARLLEKTLQEAIDGVRTPDGVEVLD